MITSLGLKVQHYKVLVEDAVLYVHVDEGTDNVCNHHVQWTITRGSSGFWLTVPILSRLLRDEHTLFWLHISFCLFVSWFCVCVERWSTVEIVHVKLDAIGLSPAWNHNNTLLCDSQRERVWMIGDWKPHSDRCCWFDLTGWFALEECSAHRSSYISCNMLLHQAPRGIQWANLFDKIIAYYFFFFFSHWIFLENRMSKLQLILTMWCR